MKKGLNWTLGILSVIVVVGLIAVGFFFYQAFTYEPETESEAKTEEVVAPEESSVEATVDFEVESGTSEYKFQQTLHEMTHQKVYATEKWGSEQITDEKINEMLAILEKEEFENEDFYHEVLTAWKEGDFSNAVEAHNEIWKWQGGTIGKAQRLLTAEEEREYIEKNFGE